MAFEVIEGGGLESIPWPEMTEAQKLEVERIQWEETTPGDGSDTAIFKYLPLSAAAISTTIETLEAIRAAMAADAAAQGIRDEWPQFQCEYVLRQLRQRRRYDKKERRST